MNPIDWGTQETKTRQSFLYSFLLSFLFSPDNRNTILKHHLDTMSLLRHLFRQLAVRWRNKAVNNIRWHFTVSFTAPFTASFIASFIASLLASSLPSFLPSFLPSYAASITESFTRPDKPVIWDLKKRSFCKAQNYHHILWLRSWIIPQHIVVEKWALPL